MENIVRQIVLEELEKLPPGTRVRTIEFVDSVIARLKENVELTEEQEADIRPLVVDVLWELHKQGIIRFDDTLIRFEKPQKRSSKTS